MPNLRPSPAEIASHRKRRDELAQELARLWRERDLEVDEARKIKQDAAIRDREERLKEAETVLKPVELVEKADQLEAKQSWALAIANWQQVADLVPKAPEPKIEIARLQERQRLAKRLQTASVGLVRRHRELGELWTEVRKGLQGLHSAASTEEDVLTPRTKGLSASSSSA